MRVYVLETGVYENHAVAGIFATAEAAIASHRARRKQSWTDHGGRWTNGLDWDDYAEVTEYEVTEEADLT